MPGKSEKNFNLPWHRHEHYWISIYPKAGEFSPQLLEMLQKASLEKLPDGGMSIKTGRDWKSAWDQVYAGLEHLGALGQVEAAVTHGPPPLRSKGTLDYKTPEFIQNIANSLWIGDALLEDRVMCYMQPVIGAGDKVFGYVEREDTPAPLTYQLELLRRSGFARIDVLHKNSSFAAYGGIK